MLFAAVAGIVCGQGVRTLEKSEFEFESQNAPHGFVDAFHRYGTLLHEFTQITAKAPEVDRNHCHIDSGIDAEADGVLGGCSQTVTGMQFFEILVVGDNYAGESQLVA